MIERDHCMPSAIGSVLRAVKKDKRILVYHFFLSLKQSGWWALMPSAYHKQIKAPQRDSVSLQKWQCYSCLRMIPCQQLWVLGTLLVTLCSLTSQLHICSSWILPLISWKLSIYIYSLFLGAATPCKQITTRSYLSFLYLARCLKHGKLWANRC